MWSDAQISLRKLSYQNSRQGVSLSSSQMLSLNGLHSAHGLFLVWKKWRDLATPHSGPDLWILSLASFSPMQLSRAMKILSTFLTKSSVKRYLRWQKPTTCRSSSLEEIFLLNFLVMPCPHSDGSFLGPIEAALCFTLIPTARMHGTQSFGAERNGLCFHRA